jgi:hypothetical protein
MCLQPTAATGSPSSLPPLKSAAAYPTTSPPLSAAATDGDKGPVVLLLFDWSGLSPPSSQFKPSQIDWSGLRA